jgi:hypothetical protein
LKGFWFLVRRVPGEFALYDKRNPVRISTGIRILDDPRGLRAASVVAKLDAELQRYWKDKRRGRDRDGQARYEKACNRARSLGLNYVPAADAALSQPLDDILRRFEMLARRGTTDCASEVSAVLGGVAAPVVMIDAMVDEFAEVIRASLASKSVRQRAMEARDQERLLRSLAIARPVAIPVG